MSRGEIWMFRFAPPDKQRPVLILTRSDMIPRLNTVTVAPLTRTIRSVPTEVVVGAESGLKEPSAINLHHVVTLPRAGLRRFVGSVSDDIMVRVRTALLVALGWDNAS
ncbi:MAG: type II toxin-antitoxin system PemK/MazF family toxin [Acidobacteriota bacterium]